MHVLSPEGEAKFWLDPTVALATSDGLQPKQLARLQRIIEERSHEIRQAWKHHFAR